MHYSQGAPCRRQAAGVRRGLTLNTHLSDTELDRQADMGGVVTSGSLSGAIIKILTQNARGVGLIPALSDFHHLLDIGAMTRILYKLHAVWLLNLPCVCTSKSFACM